MILPLLCVLIVLAVLLFAEYLWRKHLLKAEWSRKFVHIIAGTFVAFWPFVMSFHWVQTLAVLFLLGVLVSRALHIFRGIHNVRRKTLGELFYPLGVGIPALVTNNKYIFAAAILHLSLADGLAALMGLTYGKKNRYHVGSLIKSYAGTLTFMLVSLVITYWVLQTPAGHGLWPGLLMVMPLATAFVENIVPWGSDNVFIPLTVIVLLNLAPLLS